MRFFIERPLPGAGYAIFFNQLRCNQMWHTTQQDFLYSVFRYENFYKCSSHLHTTVLKISGKSSKNSLSYEVPHGTGRVGYNAFRKGLDALVVG